MHVQVMNMWVTFVNKIKRLPYQWRSSNCAYLFPLVSCRTTLNSKARGQGHWREFLIFYGPIDFQDQGQMSRPMDGYTYVLMVIMWCVCNVLTSVAVYFCGGLLRLAIHLLILYSTVQEEVQAFTLINAQLLLYTSRYKTLLWNNVFLASGI